MVTHESSMSTAQPRSRSMPAVMSTSPTAGQFSMALGEPPSTAATMCLVTAFFEPRTVTSPRRGPTGSMRQDGGVLPTGAVYGAGALCPMVARPAGSLIGAPCRSRGGSSCTDEWGTNERSALARRESAALDGSLALRARSRRRVGPGQGDERARRLVLQVGQLIEGEPAHVDDLGRARTGLVGFGAVDQ